MRLSPCVRKVQHLHAFHVALNAFTSAFPWSRLMTIVHLPTWSPSHCSSIVPSSLVQAAFRHKMRRSLVVKHMQDSAVSFMIAAMLVYDTISPSNMRLPEGRLFRHAADHASREQTSCWTTWVRCPSCPSGRRSRLQRRRMGEGLPEALEGGHDYRVLAPRSRRKTMVQILADSRRRI